MSINSIFSRALRLLAITTILIVSACSSSVQLFTNLSEREANEVYSVLLRAGFPAEKHLQDEAFVVQVPASMAGEALDLLASKGLPKDRKNSIDEIFPDDSMIASPLQEKARYLYALSQELERTLMTVDGVIEARVHIVLPERTVGVDNLTPSSVAIFIKHNQASPFPAYVSQIRELVVSSIPSMRGRDALENVSIVAIPAEDRIEEPLALTWFGPLAIKSADRFYFLGLMYFLIGLWGLSLFATYLSCVEPARRPRFLQALLQKTDEDEESSRPAQEVEVRHE